MLHRTCKLFAAALAVLAAGCLAPPEPIRLDITGAAPAVDYSDLAAILEKAVTGDGLIVPSVLEAESERLDRQLARLAVTGPNATPELFENRQETLA
ncbi:MAG: hypothetical protein ACYSTL_06160, partial [Planctomycetota bacterium]